MPYHVSVLRNEDEGHPLLIVTLAPFQRIQDADTAVEALATVLKTDGRRFLITCTEVRTGESYRRVRIP